jgi:ABC-type multidrug transport system ATPase subunit
MIAAEGVVKTFGRRFPSTAVHETTLTVDKGASVGILGAAGAGKTTLLRMFAAGLRPTAGLVTIGDFDTVRQTTKARRLLGLVPELFDFRSWNSGQELLTFWARLAGLPTRLPTDSVNALIQFLGIRDVLDDRPLGYSVGTQKRFLLLQALLTEPQVLILDELLAPLVGEEWDQMVGVVHALRQRGLTLVVSSPHLRDVRAVCDRVAVMNEGRLTRLFDTQELLRRVGERRHARIFVQAGNVPPDAMAELKKLDGVIEVKATPTATVVYAVPGKATARQVEEALKRGGVSVQSVREAELTLGDVLRAIHEAG